MKVLLADDHALVRNGLASLLQANNIEVVGEASDGLEAIDKTRQLKPDIILMDIKMPRCDGLEATRFIKAEMPQVKIIILTVSDDVGNLFEAIKSGAEGYLLKNIRTEQFLPLLSGVLAGEAAISPFLALKIIEEFNRQPARSIETHPGDIELTAREIEVLKLVASGAANKEIASTLSITDNTVKYHLRNIMGKLHLRNRTQIAAYALDRGISPKRPVEK